MVSVFLVFVAALSFSCGAIQLYETSVTSEMLNRSDLFVTLLYWGIAAVCFGSAAVFDGIRSATRRMTEKLDELAGKSG